jgi:hypothetical protein
MESLIIQEVEQVELFPQSLLQPSAKPVDFLFSSSSFLHRVYPLLLRQIGSGAVSVASLVQAVFLRSTKQWEADSWPLLLRCQLSLQPQYQ